MASVGRIGCGRAGLARGSIAAGRASDQARVGPDDVAAGSLVRVLPKHQLATTRVFLVTPARKHVPSRVTAFRELVVELLRQRPLTPE